MVPRRRWSPNCWVFVVTEARCQAAARLCLEALRPRENPALVSVLGPRQGHLGLYSGASETLSAWWPGNPAPAPPAITLPLPHCQHYDHQSWYTDEYATTTLRQQQTGSIQTPIPLFKVMFKMHLRQFCVQFVQFAILWNSFVFLKSQSLNPNLQSLSPMSKLDTTQYSHLEIIPFAHLAYKNYSCGQWTVRAYLSVEQGQKSFINH